MKLPIAVAMIIFWALTYSAVAGATWGHSAPIIIKPPVVVPPPAVVAPVAPAASTVAPAATPEPAATGGGGFNPGYLVMAGVAAYFWAAICVIERRDYPDSWFSKRMCFKVK